MRRKYGKEILVARMIVQRKASVRYSTFFVKIPTILNSEQISNEQIKQTSDKREKILLNNTSHTHSPQNTIIQ